MADSKRLAALKELSSYLETEITPANGYLHDLTDAVFRGRYKFDDDDPLPSISILESPNPDRFPNRAGAEDWVEVEQKDNWTLHMQGWVDDDKRNPTDPAHQLMADVRKALAKLIKERPEQGTPEYPDVYLLGGLILGLELEPGVVRPPDQNSAKAFFWMRVILKFTENINDPFDHR
jgi:hypothetical protein